MPRQTRRYGLLLAGVPRQKEPEATDTPRAEGESDDATSGGRAHRSNVPAFPAAEMYHSKSSFCTTEARATAENTTQAAKRSSLARRAFAVASVNGTVGGVEKQAPESRGALIVRFPSEGNPGLDPHVPLL